MSQNNSPIIYVGLDVAKASLAIDLQGAAHSLTNDSEGHRTLIKLLSPLACPCVVCEATGGYEKALVAALHGAQIKVAVIEAGRVRSFASAQGRRAKSDPIDALLLSRYGRAIEPAPTAPLPENQIRLAELSTRRQQLVQITVEERGRAEHYADPFSQKQSKDLLCSLEKQIQKCDQAIDALILQDADLKAKSERLKEIPGVGPVVASTMLAKMPELGKLTSEAAAALAGVAPYDQDSGTHKGIRRIAGGRKEVRCMLYMASLSAIRHDRILKEYYAKKIAEGREAKVVITAVMRKLIVLMNRLLKNPQFKLAE